jgi:hypothetical protein
VGTRTTLYIYKIILEGTLPKLHCFAKHQMADILALKPYLGFLVVASGQKLLVLTLAGLARNHLKQCSEVTCPAPIVSIACTLTRIIVATQSRLLFYALREEFMELQLVQQDKIARICQDCVTVTVEDTDYAVGVDRFGNMFALPILHEDTQGTKYFCNRDSVVVYDHRLLQRCYRISNII